MNAEILCVGTELLLGDTINTNATYLSQQLSKIGINVYYHSVVGDNDQRLEDQLKISTQRSDIIIITGGLGPTYDDMTKETVAKFFNRDLALNEDAVEKIKTYFERIDAPMTENNLKQALIPQGSQPINNPVGTAPGILLETGNPLKIVILLPGVPSEMKAMTEETLIPYLKNYSDKVIVSTNIRLFSIREAQVEQILHSMMVSSKNPTIAPYAKDGEVLIRVTASDKDEKTAKKLNAEVVEKIKKIFPNEIYGIDVENMETALVRKLQETGKKIACAESCTGGLFAKKITDVSGASNVFECGVCSYSNRIKNKILGVKKESLEKYTAVSEQVAKEMAEGVLNLSGADVAVSITGVAGPGDLSEKLKQGLVYIGIAYGKSTRVIRLNCGKLSRDQIRQRSVLHAMFEIFKVL